MSKIERALKDAITAEIKTLDLNLSVVERQELADALENIVRWQLTCDTQLSQMAQHTLDDIVARHKAQAAFDMRAMTHRIALAVARAALSAGAAAL